MNLALHAFTQSRLVRWVLAALAAVLMLLAGPRAAHGANVNVQAIFAPEPAAALLLTCGAMVLALRQTRRRG